MSHPDLAALEKVDFNWVTSLDSVWTDAPPVNPDHNLSAFETVFAQVNTLDQSRVSDRCLGRIIIGEGGSGKTHLARTLHSHVLTNEHHFILVDCTDIRDFWDTVLHSYVKSLQRPYQGKTQLEYLLRFLWQVSRREPSPTYFQEIAAESGEVFLTHTETLLKDLTPLLAKAQQGLGSPIVRHIIRALYLLISSDERLNDLGNSWLLGLGLESSEAAELKLNSHAGTKYKAVEIVKGLSWLMAQRAPTLLILDQLDPIITESHFAAAITEGANDQQLKAKAIIEGLGGGLSKLYDNTYRTVSVVLALKNSWDILQVTTLQSNLDRFHPPIFLAPVTSSQAIRGLLENRLRPAYETSGFAPDYPTYPFPNLSLDKLEQKGLYPRQLLRLFNEHKEKCIINGIVTEFEISTQKRPDIVLEIDFSDEVEERANAAAVHKLLHEDQEDTLGERMASLCAGLVHELNGQADVTFTYDDDFKGGKYPSLHARLRRIHHREQEREQHFCLRVLQKSNPNAFRARLGAAMTEAGIDQKLSFRNLIIIRNDPEIPGGPTTQCREAYDKFIKTGGKVVKISESDLKIIEAVRELLKENKPGFVTWLAKARPLSQLALSKQAFTSLLGAADATTDPAADPVLIKDSAASTKKAGVKEEPAAVVAPANKSGFLLPLGHEIKEDTVLGEVTIPAAALTKHTVIRAGSGGGKTVLVKRLIEEAAILGIPSIVLDPGNDLAWLGDPWPTTPAAWQDGDSAKAKKYLEKVDVVVWTPGKSQGRPLNLPVLPDLKSVADDKDSLEGAVALAKGALVPLCASGRSVSAIRKEGVLSAALRAFAKVGGKLNDFIDFLSDASTQATGNINNGPKLAAEMADLLRAAIQNNPLLDDSDQPLDIGVLFGIGKSKPRVSVISFIGLGTLEAQQQFVNQLAMALFTWIKKNPSIGPAGVTGLFVLDEAKDFLPGGSNTSPCKKSLMRLAAQARKYGLGMVVATQNPKDLDYNAVSQFATQYFGRANSPQVINFIDELLQAKGGSGEGVARLQKGQFFAASSEGIPVPVKVKIPLCLSNHPDGRPLTEREIIDRAKQVLP